ncbi:MAG: hypothetical protein ACPHRO_02240 [Nannocystaceae bacterium]
MTGRLLALVGLVSAGILAYTTYRFTGGEAVRLPDVTSSAPRDSADDEPPRGGQRSRSSLARRRATQDATLRLKSGVGAPQDPAATPELVLGEMPSAPGVPTPEEKLAMFERALERIDDNLSRSYEIDPKRKDILYQNLTQAFDALSVHLNANDPEHQEYLESARRRMMERLRAMEIDRVRVGDASPPSPLGQRR